MQQLLFTPLVKRQGLSNAPDDFDAKNVIVRVFTCVCAFVCLCVFVCVGVMCGCVASWVSCGFRASVSTKEIRK